MRERDLCNGARSARRTVRIMCISMTVKQKKRMNYPMMAQLSVRNGKTSECEGGRYDFH